MKEKGVEFPEKINTKNQTINNSGNLILNENSTIKKQNFKINPNQKGESSWTKINVIIAAIAVLLSAIGIIWSNLE